MLLCCCAAVLLQCQSQQDTDVDKKAWQSVCCGVADCVPCVPLSRRPNKQTHAQEVEPSKGHILVLSYSPASAKLTLVEQLEVHGAVYNLCPFQVGGCGWERDAFQGWHHSARFPCPCAFEPL
jgi:hypothetical protein